MPGSQSLVGAEVNHRGFLDIEYNNSHVAGNIMKGTRRVAPTERRLKSLREDYVKREQMFFGESPNFDEVLVLLKRWEPEFNQK